MRGEFLRVWPTILTEIFLYVESPLDDLPADLEIALSDYELDPEHESHDDLAAALFSQVSDALRDELKSNKFGDEPDEITQRGIDIADLSNDPVLAVEHFYNLKSEDIASEGALLDFLEDAYDIYDEYDNLLAERYRVLVQQFISKYSLRYELVEPFKLYPTLPGIFSSLIHELEKCVSSDKNQQILLDDFTTSFREIKNGSNESRIRTCLHKLILLIESISLKPDCVTGDTLGVACRQLDSWPHATVRESLSKLYGFASNYPGIRHAGNQDSKLRDLESKDLLSLVIVLAGFTPYLVQDFDCESMYLSKTFPVIT